MVLFSNDFFNTTEEQRNEKAILTFGGKNIKSLKELREHFDKEACLAALKDGRLYCWLTQHYYEQEAAAVRFLKIEDADCLRRLSKALGVSFAKFQNLSPEEAASLNAKKEEIRKYTSDEQILNNVHLTAMNQEELAGLLDAGEKEIYLCNNAFSIPINKPGITYTGIGSVSIDNPFTAGQYKRAGITVNGISLPSESNPDTEALARHAAIQNGYDDFSDTHCSLASAFHNSLKICPAVTRYQLPLNVSAASKSYTSRYECETTKKKMLSKAYDTASDYTTPGTSKCFAKEAADFYSKHLTEQFSTMRENLNTLCKIINKTSTFDTISKHVNNCRNDLLRLFEQELANSADYYRPYRLDYFMEQVEIEKNDHRVFEDFFSQALERLFTDSVDYTMIGILDAVREMESDLNEHADTFFKAAHSEYLNYVHHIEEMLESIGKDLPAMDADEALDNYLSRMCIKHAG